MFASYCVIHLSLKLNKSPLLGEGTEAYKGHIFKIVFAIVPLLYQPLILPQGASSLTSTLWQIQGP
jgi:hypothetical protein